MSSTLSVVAGTSGVFGKDDSVSLSLRKWVKKCYINSPMNFVGAVFFLISGIIGIVARSRESKDGPHDNSHFCFIFCVGIVIGQAICFFGWMIWCLEDMRSKVAVTSLCFETIVVVVLSYVIKFDEEYRRYLSLFQSLLNIFIVGSMVFLWIENCRKAKLRIVKKKLAERIKLAEGEKGNLEVELTELKTENGKLVSMEDKIKVLTKKLKLPETEKEKLEIDLADLNREKRELLMNNEASKREIEMLTTTHSLQAEKMKKIKDEALNMEGELKYIEKLYDSNKLRYVKIIAKLRWEIEGEEIINSNPTIRGMQRMIDDIKKDCYAIQERRRASIQTRGGSIGRGEEKRKQEKRRKGEKEKKKTEKTE